MTYGDAIGEGPITTLDGLIEHIEFVHEYEVAPGTTEAQIRQGHRQRHATGADHTHRGIKQGD